MFDVESLFANVPIDAAVQAAMQKKKDGVVYRIPCGCGKVYIGETGRPMQDRIKEHDRDIRHACTETSAVFRACPQHWTQATLERSKVY